MKVNTPAYLFTINKNNSFRLDPDELKDVEQSISIFLIKKSYNDLLTKKTILSFYSKAVKKKIKNEEIVSSGAYLMNHEPGAHQIEIKRREQLTRLKLNENQQRIVNLLISGFSYKEIRKKLRMNNNQLVNHISRIKTQNFTDSPANIQIQM